MKSKILKNIIVTSFSIFLFIFSFNNYCFAQGPLNDETMNSIQKQDIALASKSGFQTGFSIGDATNLIIVGFLGVLGLIFIILIIVAGFNFMTAGGDEQKVTKAKDSIRRAIIGLIIYCRCLRDNLFRLYGTG
jgi:ABC-type multidrug transport system permease subunit